MPSTETNAHLEDLAHDVVRSAGGDAVDTLPSTGLLSLYDRLRARIVRALERRAGKLGPGVASTLLLVPDVFVLMLRLAMDKEVPASTRALLASTLAYFVMPFDLLSEGALGAVGYLDDVVIALAVLAKAFGEELEPYAEKYWSGSESLRTVLGDVLGSANSLLGTSLYARVSSLLQKRGIDIDVPAPSTEPTA